MTVRKALEQSSRRILRRDAEVLLQHVMGRHRAWLLAHPEAELPATEATRLERLVARRAEHEPLQYLTGRQEFFGLDFLVTPDVLIPRPETELLVDAVLTWAGRERAQELKIVDVGTGSGAIALALASRLPGAEVWAVDLSQAALQVLERNAERVGLPGRVRSVASDLLESCAGESLGERQFDAIVSNPPYVPLNDAPTLEAEVREFEPHLALFGGIDGLAVYRRLIPQAWEALRPGGLLAMEIGFGQEEALTELLAAWAHVAFRPDYAGILRVVTAERP